MRMIKWFFTGLLLIPASAMLAQGLSHRLIASAGGFHASTAASMSWSLGEPLIVTAGNATNGHVTQGFQQPMVKIITNVGSSLEELSSKVYPNPNQGIFSLNYGSVSGKNILVKIYNAQGTLVKLQEVRLTGNRLEMSATELNPGIYSVTVLDGPKINIYKTIIE